MVLCQSYGDALDFTHIGSCVSFVATGTMRLSRPNINVDSEMSSLMALYCTNIFKIWRDNDNANNQSNQRLLSSFVDICCQIARHCRTSIIKPSRLVKM
jgi:hypothetical protein